MEWVETTGRTIEDAKEVALDQLGVDEQDAEFEVLEEPRTGLFGRTRGDARVRARVRPTQPRPKVERRDRKGRGKGPARSGDRKPKAAAQGADAAEDAAEAPAQSEQSEEKPAAKAEGRTRSEEHTSELQSLMRISYAVFCLNKKTQDNREQSIAS